jgi:two-component system, NarL family, nitrate/nitrite response regulator NarL
MVDPQPSLRDRDSIQRCEGFAGELRRMIHVLVVIAQGPYREALAGALSAAGLCVVGVAGAARGAKAHVTATKPDVVVLDLPGAEGLSFTRWCTRAEPQVRVVALSVGETEEEILSWATAGLSGYVRRDGSLTDVVETAERVAKGEAAYSGGAVAILVKHAAELVRERIHRPLLRLTSRELEVVSLIEDGLTNKEIAARLSIEVATVKNHVHNILEKLGVHSRKDAAACLRARLTTDGDRPSELVRSGDGHRMI